MKISLTFQEAISVDCGGLISHENAQATKSSMAPKAGWSELILRPAAFKNEQARLLYIVTQPKLSTLFCMVYANFNFQGEKPVPVEV
jgi:hypothetical protein